MSKTKEQEEQTQDEPEVIDGEAEELPAEPETTAGVGQAASQAMEIVRREREDWHPPAAVLPSPREWEATMAMAREIANTPFVPADYRGQPESVVAAILAGRELGIGPMQALRQIHMIDGRPAFAADLMLAKMRRGGISILDSGVSDDRAFIHAKRRDTGEEATVEWTMDDAEKAGLTGKKNWKTYRQDMLWARCVGRLARRLGSDLLGGLVYSSEELQDWEDDGDYGSYGDVGPGYHATTARAFNPATDLLPNVIRGEDAKDRIAEQLREKRPDVDWRAVITQAWDGEYTTEFWKRLANVEAKLSADHPHEMPPVSDEEIIEVFAWAFDGAVVTVTEKPSEGTGEASSEPRKRGKAKAKEEGSSDAALSREAQDAMKASGDDDDIPFGEQAQLPE